MIRELLVISGKGGTGKTSLAGSFAALAKGTLFADADVDAANLHLLLAPHDSIKREFVGGRSASIEQVRCTGCGLCASHCRFHAIALHGKRYEVLDWACEGCGLCVQVCPEDAVRFMPRRSGDWIASKSRFGPLVWARLDPGAENSGKLVSTVRHEARRQARDQGLGRVLIDGPPGIGCSVIASMTGVTHALIVTEPSPAALHDMSRLLELAAHFGVPSSLCVNKWDLEPELTNRIETVASRFGTQLAGRVRYDPEVTRAQLRGLTAVELNGPSATDIMQVWENVNRHMAGVAHAPTRYA